MGKLFKTEKGEEKVLNSLKCHLEYQFNSIFYLWVSDASVYNEVPLVLYITQTYETGKIKIVLKCSFSFSLINSFVLR